MQTLFILINLRNFINLKDLLREERLKTKMLEAGILFNSEVSVNQLHLSSEPLPKNPENPITIYKFQSKSTGQMKKSEVIVLSAQETLVELCFHFSKGLKFLALTTDQQEKIWGFKDEESEPFILTMKPLGDNAKIGRVSFGFSLSGNKFGSLGFSLY